MSNNNKTPAIRFKGFTDTWEQRKLSQFVEFYTGLTYSPSDVQETGTLVLRSSNVKNGAVIDADNVYVNDEVVDSENVRRGDIIVVVRNGSRALIGKHAEIREEMPKTVIGAFMTGIRSNHSSFVNALLSTQQFENEVAMNMGATINQITGYMFAKMSFMIPEGEEQDKIGVFFKDLDHLITLRQRKYDKLIQFKAAMLQKMFPQNGADKPEIRFKGFADAWEQRKCSDFIKLVGGATPSKANKDYWDGDIVWLSSQEIKGGFVSKGTYNITQKAVDDNTTKMIPANTPMFISRSGILANSFPITRALCNVAINQDIKALLFDHTVFFKRLYCTLFRK